MLKLFTGLHGQQYSNYAFVDIPIQIPRIFIIAIMYISIIINTFIALIYLLLTVGIFNDQNIYDCNAKYTWCSHQNN